jgi:hypothetical protein
MAETQAALHPAAEWASEVNFTPLDVDCTTTVVLKILDGKCKMLPGEKTAVLAVYDVVRQQPGERLDPRVHLLINQARLSPSVEVMQHIHVQRVEAEARISKPEMKAYKAVLRDGLFG